MGSCELCGSKSAQVNAIVEGVRVAACVDCGRSGTILATPVRDSPKKSRRTTHEPEEIEEIRHDFASILRSERRKRDMTQSQFAEYISEKESTLVHYENGSKKPGIAAAKRIERKLNITLIESFSTTPSFEIKKSSLGGLTIGDMIKFK